MTEAIQVALITGGFALLGTYLTVRSGNNKILTEMQKHEAVQDEKIQELTREVRAHNEFAVRIPVLQEQINQLRQREIK